MPESDSSSLSRDAMHAFLKPKLTYYFQMSTNDTNFDYNVTGFNLLYSSINGYYACCSCDDILSEAKTCRIGKSDLKNSSCSLAVDFSAEGPTMLTLS